MAGWLLVSLSPNEMTNKTLTELFEICNSSWRCLVKPYFGYSFQYRWECPAHHLVWGHLHNINVLNDSMWSKGSLEPSYDSNYGRRNFGERGWFSTSVVNGESVLQIIPPKFSLPLSFMILFNSSISFLTLWSSFSILEESSPEVLSCLLAWEFDSFSFCFPHVHRCFVF